MIIVSRKGWGARYSAGAVDPKTGRSIPAPLPAREVWLHHSVTVAPDLVPPFDDEDAAMRLLEQIGQDRFGQGVSYTFAIMPTGRIYEGHGVGTRGAHTKNRNSIARAIVFVGNYDVDHPTPEQEEAAAWLLAHGHAEGWWRSVYLSGGHRDAPGAATACPGRFAEQLVPDINARAVAIAAGAPPLSEEDPLSTLTPDEARSLVAAAQLIELAFRPVAGKPAFAVPGQVTLSLGKIEGGLATILANQAAAGAAVDVDDLAARIVDGMGDELAGDLLQALMNRLGAASAAPVARHQLVATPAPAYVEPEPPAPAYVEPETWSAPADVDVEPAPPTNGYQGHQPGRFGF